jgi:hypothetical protein
MDSHVDLIPFYNMVEGALHFLIKSDFKDDHMYPATIYALFALSEIKILQNYQVLFTDSPLAEFLRYYDSTFHTISSTAR